MDLTENHLVLFGTCSSDFCKTIIFGVLEMLILVIL